MPSVLRSLANRGLWAGLTGLMLTAPTAAQPPDDPIAASNRLSDPWVAPRQVTPIEAPKPSISEPRAKAPVLRTERETTQPNRGAVAYWADGLEPIYLEGAFNRAQLVTG